MKLLLLTLLCFISICSYSQPTYEWSMRFGASYSEYIQTIRIDDQENIYAYGYVSGAPSNPVNIVGFPIISVGMHLIKMDANQNILWSKNVMGQVNQNAKALAIDHLGNSYVIGTYFNTINFDGIQLTGASSASSAYLAKIDNNGDFVWVKNITCDPLFGEGSVQSRSVECDALGNVIIGGDFDAAMLDFNGTSLSNLGSPSYTSNDYIAKYNPDGTLMWAKNVGSLKSSVCDFHLSTDNENAIIVTTGIKNDTLIFANDTLTNPFPGTYKMLIAKFDYQGNEIWARTAHAQAENSGAYGESVTCDHNNNVYVGGTYGGSINLTPQTTSLGNDDLLIAKYDEYGNFVWIRTVGGTGHDHCNSIAVDSEENVYLSGWFSGSSITFGDTTLSNPNWNLTTIFIAKYDITGNRQFIDVIGGNHSDEPRHLTADNNDDIYIAGFFKSASIEFGNNILLNDSLYTSDAFIAKIDGTNSNSLGVHDFQKTDYVIFPNPYRDQFTIQVDNIVQNASLIITDIYGAKIHEMNNLFGNEIKVSPSELPDGIYFINLFEDGASVLNERIIASSFK